MTSPSSQIRRILIALDASNAAPGNLGVATELASRLRAELLGLFVVDDELLQLAALPFTTQVNMTTGGRQPLDPAELETQMANLAAFARRRLETMATRDRVTWSFRTVRGRIANEVASAAEGTDLVIVEGGHHGGPAHARFGLPTSATAMRVTQSVLILRDGRRVEGRIFVVFDGTAQSEKAMQMSNALTPDKAMLTILLPQSKYQALETRARELLGDSAEAVKMEAFSADTLADLCQHVGRSDTGLVVVGADNRMLLGSDIASLLNSVTCTVLLVR